MDHAWVLMNTKSPQIKPLIIEALIISRKFLSYGKLQRVLIEVIATRIMTVKELQIYLEIFFVLNISATGSITRLELLEAYWKYGLSDANADEVDNIFAMVDRDNSGLISFDEFVRICT
jgi:Ca2+-binding EF-hand superfamily protein